MADATSLPESIDKRPWFRTQSSIDEIQAHYDTLLGLLDRSAPSIEISPAWRDVQKDKIELSLDLEGLRWKPPRSLPVSTERVLNHRYERVSQVRAVRQYLCAIPSAMVPSDWVSEQAKYGGYRLLDDEDSARCLAEWNELLDRLRAAGLPPDQLVIARITS